MTSRTRPVAATAPPPSPDAELLAGRGIAYVSRSYRALDFRFRVQTDDVALGRYLDEIFAAFPIPADHCPVATYSLLDLGGGAELRYLLFCDDQHLLSAATPASQLDRLLWHINRRVVEVDRRHLLIHAAAAEWNGTGLVLPAPMESGKTTLVAGLVRAGLRYLTDETVAIDPARGLIDPYPRSLSVDSGSWETLHDLAPRLPEGVAPYRRHQWQVPPESIRPGAVAPPTRPGFVITPGYEQGAKSRLTPLRRSEAVSVLADNAFNFRAFGQRGLEVLGALVGNAQCFRLVVGDLDEACQLVAELLSDGNPDEEEQ